MEYYQAVNTFCRESATRMCLEVPCDLKPYTITTYDEVCKNDPTTGLKTWTTVPVNSEILELVKNVAVNHRVFIVGNWVHMVHREAVDAFNPEEVAKRDYMFPLHHVDYVVAALTMNALFNAVLVELQRMQPHLKRAAEPALDLELLYDPTPDAVVRYSGGIPDDVKAKYANNICAWVQCVSYDCYRIGIKGCSGKSFYVVQGVFYVSDSEAFDRNNKSTYFSAEPYVHDFNWMMDKLTKASRNWLSAKPTDKRTSNAPNKRSSNAPVVNKHPVPPPAKEDAPASDWRTKDACPKGPEVDDDGFAKVSKKSTKSTKCR
jgi:hypothetical protein